MTKEEVLKYRYLVKGLSVCTIDPAYIDEFFTKAGTLRRGWVATNEL